MAGHLARVGWRVAEDGYVRLHVRRAVHSPTKHQPRPCTTRSNPHTNSNAPHRYMYSRPDAEKDCIGGGAISTIENLLDDGLISTKAKLVRRH